MQYSILFSCWISAVLGSSATLLILHGLFMQITYIRLSVLLTAHLWIVEEKRPWCSHGAFAWLPLPQHSCLVRESTVLESGIVHVHMSGTGKKKKRKRKLLGISDVTTCSVVKLSQWNLHQHAIFCNILTSSVHHWSWLCFSISRLNETWFYQHNFFNNLERVPKLHNSFDILFLFFKSCY